ncbi:MAG: sigma-70 family RNA polymerase sigma factor [Prevotellaceae bacterium]|jgi:RNA polymerase sigma-70 factor (ECF subfamily)|nr:sigma-70 family RNA polymerase sigma factor [Prevotellaceae bacterium]
MELKQFKRTVLPLRDKLLGYARKLTDSPEDAEDAVQEVLLKLWNKRLELERCRNIEAFAMTVTHHLCMDMWRSKHAPALSLEEVQIAATGQTPVHQVEMDDEINLMHRLIDALPALQRTIMRMKDVEEYETEEIAAITGCAPEAIRSNLSRARKKVRDHYFEIVKERNQ